MNQKSWFRLQQKFQMFDSNSNSTQKWNHFRIDSDLGIGIEHHWSLWSLASTENIPSTAALLGWIVQPQQPSCFVKPLRLTTLAACWAKYTLLETQTWLPWQPRILHLLEDSQGQSVLDEDVDVYWMLAVLEIHWINYSKLRLQKLDQLMGSSRINQRVDYCRYAKWHFTCQIIHGE